MHFVKKEYRFKLPGRMKRFFKHSWLEKLIYEAKYYI